MFRKIILSVIGVLVMQMLPAQNVGKHLLAPSLVSDSVDLAYDGKKRLGQSAASVAGVNLGVW